MFSRGGSYVLHNFILWYYSNFQDEEIYKSHEESLWPSPHLVNFLSILHKIQLLHTAKYLAMLGKKFRHIKYCSVQRKSIEELNC